MEQAVVKKIVVLENDVECLCKDITEPIESSPDFHNHDGYEILLILGGTINFYTESGGMQLVRGDLVCICEYDFHRADLLTEDRYDRIVINIRKERLVRASGEDMDLTGCFCQYPAPIQMVHLSEKEIAELEGYAHLLQESTKRNKPGDEILEDAFLKLIMVNLIRRIRDYKAPRRMEIMPELVVETLSYIESHLTEEITLKKLEKHVHHNGTYLSRCFKRITGITLQQFIIAKKITFCCKLLREGYPPGDVCYMAGFNDYSNYSRTFSKQVGMSPKRYQIENR